jgi:hypothetical protein
MQFFILSLPKSLQQPSICFSAFSFLFFFVFDHPPEKQVSPWMKAFVFTTLMILTRTSVSQVLSALY